MMNRLFAAAISIPNSCARRISTTGVQYGKADLSKIRQKQAHFQMDNDTPVYIKGGSTDYFLFITALGLIAFSLVTGGQSVYHLATKK